MIRRLSREEFLTLFAPSVHQDILALAERYPDSEALVCFEVLAMDSSHYGERTCVACGPRRTVTTEHLAALNAHIGGRPSRFAYPVAMWQLNTSKEIQHG